jgi:hypothetical protein
MAGTVVSNPTRSRMAALSGANAMAAGDSASAGPTAEQTNGPRPRRRLHPAQRQLLFAAFGVIVGSFLPWVTINMGLSYSGFAGAGLYTFYLGIFGIAAGLVPRRRMAAVQGGIVALGAVGLPLWQLLHLVSRVGLGGWLPGAGLIMVLASGVLAGLSTWQLVRS